MNERDFFAAQRLANKFRNGAQAILCEKVDLRLFPSTILQMDHDDNIDLFGASDAGFTPLSRQEAARLRVSVQDFLLKPNADAALQGVQAN